DARRTAASGGGAPDAEGDVALAAFLEGGGQDRQCRRREQRGAEALERAEGDQRALRPGKAVEQRADREQREPGDEQTAPAEQVGHAAAEQEGAAEQDRVRRPHPLPAPPG